MGYGEATMEEVARACGMAKKTVYKLFPDKPALFRALVQSHHAIGLSAPVSAKAHDQLGEMSQLLHDLASFILSPRQIVLTRLVISEARKSPDLADLFYRECIERAQSLLVERLSVRSDSPFRGMSHEEAVLLVDMFLGATLGQLHLRALILDADQDRLLEQLKKRVDFAMRMFRSNHPES